MKPCCTHHPIHSLASHSVVFNTSSDLVGFLPLPNRRAQTSLDEQHEAICNWMKVKTPFEKCVRLNWRSSNEFFGFDDRFFFTKTFKTFSHGMIRILEPKKTFTSNWCDFYFLLQKIMKKFQWTQKLRVFVYLCLCIFNAINVYILTAHV